MFYADKPYFFSFFDLFKPPEMYATFLDDARFNFFFTFFVRNLRLCLQRGWNQTIAILTQSKTFWTRLMS